MSRFKSTIESALSGLSGSEQRIVNEVWTHRVDYIKWPAGARLLWPGCVRTRYHWYPLLFAGGINAEYDIPAHRSP